MDALIGGRAPRDVCAGRRTPWRALVVCLFGYLLGFCAWSAPGDVAEEAQPAYGVKAAFLYKFLSYIEWRPGTFAEPKSPIVVGVIGADDIADSLRALATDRPVGNRPVDVRRLRGGDALDGVHVLFVGADEAARVARLASRARERGVLLVTDFEGALDEGSAINLVVIERRVRFEVSLDAAEKSGLKLSSRLLGVASSVRPAAAQK